jgi:uncharacterized protein (TIGR02444 family)
MTQAASKAPPQNSPLWDFSVRFYRTPGLGDACIRLQDEVGVDVNVLLFLLWNASLKRRFSAAEVAAIDRHVAAWRQNAVIPLRNVRRALKAAPGPLPAGEAEVFRTKIKGLELEAERLQQQALDGYTPSTRLGETANSAEEAARANVAAYETVVGRRFPQAAADAVLGAFKKFLRC